MRKIHSYTTTNGTVHNGGGKRNGSFAVYLEPWHADIKNWLQLKSMGISITKQEYFDLIDYQNVR